MAKKRIAILGGGPAGLSAALRLSEKPGWKREYEITLYQMGWRLGGKGASGRNEDSCQRIEEHGIHLFASMYANTFHTMNQVLGEVKWEPNEPAELQTIEKAFTPSNYQMICDFYDNQWHRLGAYLPANDAKPWEGDFAPSGEQLVEEMLALLYSLLTGKPAPIQDQEPPSNLASRALHWMIGEIADLTEAGVGLLLRSALHATRANPQLPSREHHAKVLESLERICHWAGHQFRGVVEPFERWRWLYIQFDYYTTLLRGIIDDRVFEKGIDSIDSEGYREWLTRHGIDEMTLNSALPQAVTNICFHYPEGTTDLPRMSAAAYVTFVIRQFLGRGQAMYFFRTGTGESIIMPIYRVLKQRGVNFAFFHKVTDIAPDADGTSIGSIDVDIQATTTGGKPYEPLKKLERRHQYVWPDRPRYEQLEQGEKLREEKVDLESWWSQWPAVEKKTLRKGTDFDYVVLATSIAPLPHIAPKLVSARTSWQQMIDQLPTVATRQVQIWLDRTTAEMGWDLELGGTNRHAGPTYANPLCDVADFSDLVAWEEWPEGSEPRGLIYFCGGLQDPAEIPPFTDAGYPAREKLRVGAEAVQYLRAISGLLPRASRNPVNPRTLDFDSLVCADPAFTGSGTSRFEQQYYRANVDPNERFVLSLPGSASARLKAWESGYDNLALAGDWIDTGINLGCFEAAMMGGMLASHALVGYPALPDILAYDFLHPGAGIAPDPMIGSGSRRKP